MKKTRLTSNLKYELSAIIFIPALILIGAWPFLIDYRFLLIIIALFACFGYYFYYFINMQTIEFDNDFVYFISRKLVEKLPLQNITKIQRQMGGFSWSRSFWKMDYLDSNNNLNKITFVPKKDFGAIDKLQQLVKSKNPKALTQLSEVCE